MGRKRYLRKSVIQNWKVKKFIKHDGNVFYRVYYRSIFRLWFELKDEGGGYDGSYSIRITFKTLDDAKKRIREEIVHSLAQAGSYVHNVEEIKF